MRHRTLIAIGTCLFVGVASAHGPSGAYTTDKYKNSDANARVSGSSGMQGSLSRVLDRLDHDANGIVTKDEARQHTWFSDQLFTQYDKDMNGNLDKVEIQTAGSTSLNDPGT
jgi:hypothetical protein